MTPGEALADTYEAALREIADTPFSMVNDSESLRFSLRQIVARAEAALRYGPLTKVLKQDIRTS